MKVNFRDFTNKQSVHDYLVKNSKKKVVKCECRIIDDNGVVLDHLDSFVENCGDIKYYFGDDESLEINKMNSVAMFVRANGDKVMVEHIDNNFEDLFVDMINRELGLNFKATKNSFSCIITCALALEFNEARNQLGLEEITTKKDIPRIAQNRNITLVYTGIGKINSSIHLSKILTQSSFDLVIDSGTCGSLKENIKPFDIVISKKTIDFYNLKQRGTEFNSNYKGNILSNDTTVGSIESSITTSNSVDMLKNMGVDIVTWESAAIFAVSKNFNTEVISIRGVTDSCNGNTISDFKQNRVKVCKKLYNRIKTFCNSV